MVSNSARPAWLGGPLCWRVACAGGAPRGIQTCEGVDCAPHLESAPHLALAEALRPRLAPHLALADALGARLPLVDASDALHLTATQGLSGEEMGSLAAAQPPIPTAAAAPGLVRAPAPAQVTMAAQAPAVRGGRSLLQRLADSGGALLARQGPAGVRC